MSEERIVLTNAHKEKLVGILQKAESDDIAIICHGSRYSKESKPIVDISNALLKERISTFRFDFSGNGESEGKLSYANYWKEVEDLRTVIVYLSNTRNIPVRAIIGHSKGGNDVILYASKYHVLSSYRDPEMADNCSVLESWVYEPSQTTSFADEFIYGADIFSRDLQASLSYNGSSSTNTTTPDSSLPHTPTGPLPALTYSPFDNLTTQKRLQLPVGPPKKITKRKSRASKRSPTKYFTADPANFREMVQQITGFQANVIKPEPKRMMIPQSSSMPSTTSLLEINEMSPFMLDDQVLPPQPTQQQHQDRLFESYSVGKNEFSGFGKDCFSSSSSFYPTLESWNGIIM